jgi:hypothetical protein
MQIRRIDWDPAAALLRPLFALSDLMPWPCGVRRRPRRASLRKPRCERYRFKSVRVGRKSARAQRRLAQKRIEISQSEEPILDAVRASRRAPARAQRRQVQRRAAPTKTIPGGERNKVWAADARGRQPERDLRITPWRLTCCARLLKHASKRCR